MFDLGLQGLGISACGFVLFICLGLLECAASVGGFVGYGGYI